MKRILYFLGVGLIFWSCSKDDIYNITTDFEGKFVFINSNSSGDLHYDVFTLDHDGVKQVTFTDTADFYKGNPNWVKNGEYIQYEEYPLCLFCYSFGKNKIIRADGTEPTDYNMPFISPDNKYGCTYTLENLFIFNLDGNLKKLNQIGSVLDYGDNKTVKWAPDSKRLLFTLGSELVNYNINTKIITPLFEFDNVLSTFEWSYVGDKIAFIWLDDVYVVNADGSNVQNLTSSPNKEYDIAWSPTEDILAYTQRNLDYYNGLDNIFLYDFTDSTEQSLDLVEQAKLYIDFIQWSADGMSFAFSAMGAENTGIFIIDRDGTTMKKVYDKQLYSFDWYSK